jgi:NADPH-dependent glutamate synthase beta subunit-like oxidoreductase
VIVLSTISSLMTYYQVYNKSTTTGATIGAGTANLAKAHELIRVTQSVVF